jgi:hypothetical protein
VEIQCKYTSQAFTWRTDPDKVILVRKNVIPKKEMLDYAHFKQRENLPVELADNKEGVYLEMMHVD